MKAVNNKLWRLVIPQTFFKLLDIWNNLCKDMYSTFLKSSFYTNGKNIGKAYINSDEYGML